MLNTILWCSCTISAKAALSTTHRIYTPAGSRRTHKNVRSEHAAPVVDWPMRFLTVLVAICQLPSFAAPADSRKIPPGMFPVKPISSARAADLQIARGHFFSYALPQGWRVGEDGQFALTLVAPDSKALTIMVGNAGLPPNYPPGRFVQEKLMAIRPENLQIGQPRQATPVTGFKQAWQ